MDDKITTITPIRPKLKAPPKLLRVAAYARVSSGKDSMLHSLSAQVSYYSELIQKNPTWSYCGVYADEDFTGTKANRPEFQRMLADCRAGKLDLILCKSNTRFARNTVTMLETARELKTLGVDCYFEEEDIHTLSEKGEFLLTLRASFVQEESLSVSENCKWKIRHGFQDGKPTYTTIFGYRMKKGNFIIVPEEAEIVKTIFALFLSGMGRNAIMKRLNEEGVTTRSGKPFTETVIACMLQNEKYVEDLYLQKTFIADHLTKKVLPNRGEVQQYYVTDNHEGIIDRDIFEKVQAEIKRRSQSAPKRSAAKQYPFTGMIICGNCGCHYKRKITGGKVAWNCVTFIQKGKAVCHVTGMIICGNCGCHYKRKITNGKVAWNCVTFIQKGKAVCHAKQIPEDVLYTLSADVLGLEAFDEDVFKANIAELHIPAFNHITFKFLDGHEVERVWQDRSRSESWTPEMRERAKAYASTRYAPHDTPNAGRSKK